MENPAPPKPKKKYMFDIESLNLNFDSDEPELQFEEYRANIYMKRFKLQEEIEAPYLQEIERLTKK
jgi:hypothetical protein